jgi:(S)-2-hydroxyglutarate dehydrogenase
MNPVSLGVHSTITTDGYVKIGPSAAPAFSSENYQGGQNLKFKEIMKIIRLYTKMGIMRPNNFFSLAFKELPKLQKSRMISDL